MQADLLSNTCEWYTPSPILEIARLVLGSIDLDPASCDRANELVKAKSIITVSQNALNPNTIWQVDGIDRPNVWLNPPSRQKSKINPIYQTSSIASAFWRRLVKEYRQNNIGAAIYLVISSKLIHLNPDMLDYPICFTSSKANSKCITKGGRIKFIDINGLEQSSPTQTNAFVLLPRNNEQSTRFRELFSVFGKVIN